MDQGFGDVGVDQVQIHKMDTRSASNWHCLQYGSTIHTSYTRRDVYPGGCDVVVLFIGNQNKVPYGCVVHDSDADYEEMDQAWVVQELTRCM